MSLASANLVSACTCDVARLKESPFRFQEQQTAPLQSKLQPGQEISRPWAYRHLRPGFRDISRESYKTLDAKWPRADWQGGVELVFVDSPV